MSGVDNSNEITVKVTCSKDELIRILENEGLKFDRAFSLDDYYFIPNNINVEDYSTRALIAMCPIVRNIVDNGVPKYRISFKFKEFNDNDEIISQKDVYCNVMEYKDAIKLLEAMGYKMLINIKEDDVVYKNDEIEFAVKSVVNGDLMIEMETGRSTKYDTIDKLKQAIKEFNIPIEDNNYFVKKAEVELNKKLNR